MKMKRYLKLSHISLAAISGLLLTIAAKAQAAAGDLDPLFGDGGAVLTDFSGTTDDYAHAVAFQSDGKLIVAGQTGVYPLFHSALVRYNRNGRLDPTFGNGGKVVAALDSGGDALSAVALQADGKIVVAGSLIHNNEKAAFLVARFNSDGSRDSTFGKNGRVVTTFGDSSAGGNDLVLQADGRIVVVGVSGAGSASELNDFALARYNSNGSPDVSFGNGGKFKTHFPGVYNTGSEATAVALQSDGKLVVGGSYKNEGDLGRFALARYNSNGSLDPLFGNRGEVTSIPGRGLGLGLQLDGRIVLAGYAGESSNDFAVACFNSNGNVDQSFGANGYVTTDFFNGSNDIAYAVALQRDGKIVVAGRTGEYPDFALALARYQSDGQLDASFGRGGKVATGAGVQAYAVGIRKGKIVAAGFSFANGSNYDFFVARFLGQ